MTLSFYAIPLSASGDHVLGALFDAEFSLESRPEISFEFL